MNASRPVVIAQISDLHCGSQYHIPSLATRVVDGRTAHGKLTIVDGRVALVGSLALSASSLELRRELGLLVTEAHAVRRLEAFVRTALRGGPV